jgi:D-arginine dehydrogenase
MATSDVLIIGGGIAGLSAAAALARDARVIVLEGEEQVGFHASGRSATMLHYALGDRLVRSLTLASRSFLESPPDGFTDVPLGRRMPVLVHARENEREQLDALEAEIAPFAALDRLDERGIAELCPLLKVGAEDAQHAIADLAGIRLDPHALLQGFVRALRRSAGELRTGARVSAIARHSDHWLVTTEVGDAFAAPVVVNATGAWADAVAALAGVEPLGLRPMRRTIITFDAPEGTDLAHLPFAKTVGDELYFAPESGRLFASPMDEVPTDPCDAQPDDFEVALAAHRVEERTVMTIPRIHSRWAGLRTFAPDRHPVAGFAPDAEGFFWLAGQGGFGLQTSPAMAAITRALIRGTAWPLPDVAPEALGPDRFAGQAA